MEWYLAVMRNYAGFEGRARRREYWMFSLFNGLFTLAAIVLDAATGGSTMPLLDYGPFQILYGVATFIPSLAVLVRRLHDVGKTGWYLLVVLIPILGAIWLLVLACTEGDAGVNKYGADPKKGQRSR